MRDLVQKAPRGSLADAWSGGLGQPWQNLFLMSTHLPDSLPHFGSCLVFSHPAGYLAMLPSKISCHSLKLESNHETGERAGG